ncbi:MAG: hypothetical protein PHT84_05245 [Candidatus Pacebacteria bacterium]|nr:hypothetical protein [Candidatus Paceibacterota bacterium]
MSLFLTFLFFLLVSWLAEKQSGQPGDFLPQSNAIRFSVFPAIAIRPQLFDAKSLHPSFHFSNHHHPTLTF